MTDPTFRLCCRMEGHSAASYREMSANDAERWLAAEIREWLAAPHGLLRLYRGNDLITFERCDDAALERAAQASLPTYDDIVDEASDKSFPASDPPAWSASHAAATRP